MNQTARKGKTCGMCALAFLLALLFLAIVLPNTGRVVADHSTTPPIMQIVGRLRYSLIAIGVVTVPLALIVIGTFRRSRLTALGWVLLGALVVMAFMNGV